MKKLGLLGYPLGHSFSKKYYLEKFERENIRNISYELYSLENVADFRAIYENDPEFHGFNVTIPHKQAIARLVDELSPEAAEIQAVNCVTIHREGDAVRLKGYNTDADGFERSLRPLLSDRHRQALVLGNGGAAKAVFYTLRKLDIPFKVVSRSREKGDLLYEELTTAIIQAHQLIINCSPIGTFPHTEEAPRLPYDAITADHLLYDLIYNPEETLFLRRGRERGAITKNGYEMLLIQAERNWEIWKDA